MSLTKSGFARLNEKNHENLARSNQRFYLARVEGRVAAVTFTLSSASVTGVYAVATLEEHRKKGISSAMLAHAIDDSSASGATTIALQVKRVLAPAERLYRTLGSSKRSRRPFSCAGWRSRSCPSKIDEAVIRSPHATRNIAIERGNQTKLLRDWIERRSR